MLIFFLFDLSAIFMSLTFLRESPFMISYVASRKNRKYIRFMGASISYSTEV